VTPSAAPAICGERPLADAMCFAATVGSSRRLVPGTATTGSSLRNESHGTSSGFPLTDSRLVAVRQGVEFATGVVVRGRRRLAGQIAAC
jgi:hypothetical protein